MAVKPDSWIRRLAQERGLIEPFSEAVRNGVVSYCVSSYGYDMRVADEFVVFQPEGLGQGVIDPKDASGLASVTVRTDGYCLVPAHGFVLARSLEYFRIPRDVLALCVGKSTYARCGLLVNITPPEPVWEGHVTIEISNTTPLPARGYANEGIAQVLFLSADGECEVSYADKGGKYQGQRGITLARV